MTSPVRVDIASLRAQLNQLLNLFEEQGVRSVALDADFYWSVPLGSEYIAKDANAPELHVGSLVDDLEVLIGVGEEPVALMLCYAAPLLHYLGQRASDYGVL